MGVGPPPEDGVAHRSLAARTAGSGGVPFGRLSAHVFHDPVDSRS